MNRQDLLNLKDKAWQNLRGSIKLIDALETIERFMPENAVLAGENAALPASVTEARQRLPRRVSRRRRTVVREAQIAKQPRIATSSKDIPQWQFMAQLVGNRKMTTREIAEEMQAKGWKFRSRSPKGAVIQSLLHIEKFIPGARLTRFKDGTQQRYGVSLPEGRTK